MLKNQRKLIYTFLQTSIRNWAYCIDQIRFRADPEILHEKQFAHKVDFIYFLFLKICSVLTFGNLVE